MKKSPGSRKKNIQKYSFTLETEWGGLVIELKLRETGRDSGVVASGNYRWITQKGKVGKDA